MNKYIDRDNSNAIAVEEALLFLSLYDKGFGIPDPRFFDGVIFGWTSQFDMLAKEFSVGGRKGIETFAASMKPIAGSIICMPDTEYIKEYKYHYVGGRELSYNDKKKRLSFGPLPCMRNVCDANGNVHTETFTTKFDPFSDRLVELRSVMVAADGRSRVIIRDTAYCNSRGFWEPLIHKDIITNCAFDMAVLSTWASRIKWSISIRLEEAAPSARFFTDPTGIKDFLRFRDIPEGRARREALAHWVSEHWRQDRKDPEMELYVREHLRGATRCHWHRMDVEIGIPPVDQARAETAKIERKKRPKLGTDRRKRHH